MLINLGRFLLDLSTVIWTSPLTSHQRLALAAVMGAGQRRCFGTLSGRPRDEAVAHIRDQTTDPVVLGFALGAALAST